MCVYAVGRADHATLGCAAAAAKPQPHMNNHHSALLSEVTFSRSVCPVGYDTALKG